MACRCNVAVLCGRSVKGDVLESGEKWRGGGGEGQGIIFRIQLGLAGWVCGCHKAADDS